MTQPAAPLLPTVREVIGAARDGLTAERPGASEHLDTGNYGLLVEGWRGQFGVANRRLGDEAAAARLGSSTGQALRELAASNYDTPSTGGPTFSVGEITLKRVVFHGGPSPSFSTITVDDATTYISLITLLAAIATALSNGAVGHIKSVFDPVTAQGAHVVADSSATLALSDAVSIGGLAIFANTCKLAANRHFQNQRIDTGAALGIHRDPDTARVITFADFTPTAPLDPFSSSSATQQAGVYAVANVVKRAVNLHVAAESLPGTIRKGTPFRLAAVAAAVPPIAGGQYLAALDAYVRTDANTAVVPVVAAQPGAATNTPAWSSSPPTLSLSIGASLFDTFTATALVAAGGGTGQPDETLRGAARAGWTGTVGPTVDAIAHGSLRAEGVVKAPILEDLTEGRVVAYPVDVSWAQSARWKAQIEAALRLGTGDGADDERLGFGCQLAMGAVVNRVVRVEIEVKLRDARFLADTEALTASLRATLLAYFNDRPGWWTWSLAGIRGACSIVDRTRVISCPTAVVRDAAGIVLSEPAAPAAGDTLTHWWLADSAVEVGFLTPS